MVGAIAEVAPARLEPSDRTGIRAHLREHGFACVRGGMTALELSHARDLLWEHLQGTEATTQRMTRTRPLGWRRGEPRTWLEGHGDALMTSTTHCASMWYARSRPGVIAAFHAAYGTTHNGELIAAYDRMSINLPTSSGNPETLRVAATTSQNGKFGVAQQMHTHSGEFYKGYDGPEYYAIVPLFGMNRQTGATALVPGSHLKVEKVNEQRERRWGGESRGQDSKEAQLAAASDTEVFSRCDLAPAVTNIRAGDCVLFDTRLFHGGYAAEDPSGESGNGPNELLRAIYILGMAPTRLQTPAILAARRKAYELDIFWPPPVNHAQLAQHILRGAAAAERTGDSTVTISGHPRPYSVVRRFADADPATQRLIDPTSAASDSTSVAAKKPRQLSQAEVERFHTDGFVVVRRAYL